MTSTTDTTKGVLGTLCHCVSYQLFPANIQCGIIILLLFYFFVWRHSSVDRCARWTTPSWARDTTSWQLRSAGNTVVWCPSVDTGPGTSITVLLVSVERRTLSRRISATPWQNVAWWRNNALRSSVGLVIRRSLMWEYFVASSASDFTVCSRTSSSLKQNTNPWSHWESPPSNRSSDRVFPVQELSIIIAEKYCFFFSVTWKVFPMNKYIFLYAQ